MPRQARLDAPGTLHHVMIRGIEGKAIFRDNRDRKEFVTPPGNLSRERGALEGRIIKEMCEEGGIGEGELKLGGQARRVSRGRAKIARRLTREYGIQLAEIARDLGVCTSAIAKAVRKLE